MTLPAIDPGPDPAEEELRPFLRDASDANVARMLAEIEWRVDLRRRDPDAFLVPFSTAAFPALGFRTYDAYRASQLWRRIKTHELRKAGGKCAGCGTSTRTIHHRDYRPRVLSGEDRSALIALCQPCHDHVHYASARKERSWNDSERVLRDLVKGGSPDD